MNISDSPKKQPVPFGVNGSREDILSTTPAGDNTASYDAGFPPVTMILKSAGGLPPKGQDMNQILYELAAVARWSGAGGNYTFDSTFSTDISGYPLGATVLSSDGAGKWINTTNANTTNPEASNYALTGWLPLGFTGATTVALTTSNVTLTSLQAAREVLVLTGTLSGNLNLIVPAWNKRWQVINNCSGSYSVTIKTNSGTGIAVPNGSAMLLRGDGTNVLDANVSLNITGSPSTTTQAVGDSSTKLATTAFVAARAINMARFTSSGSWTCPAGVTTAYLSGCAAGAGGGGGGGSVGTGASSGAGGGGGAGASAVKQPVTVVPGTVYTITIGSGGVGGNGGAVGASGSDGTDGGNTSFGALLTLTGGGRGFGGGGVAPGSLGGGLGGSYGGGGGGGGSSSLSVYPVGGTGGSSPFGTPGGATRNGTSSGSGVVTGTPGYGYGAGGGGGGGQTNSTGGIGSQGQVGLPGLLIVEW